MGRRSDHTRDELRALIVDTGEILLSTEGLDAFSAREVAKRIGYSVGTIYNVFASSDELILAINARTLDRWTAAMQRILAEGGPERLRAVALGYLDFAEQNRHSWTALFAHRLPGDTALPAWYAARLENLFGVLEAEVVRVIGRRKTAGAFARTLFAAIHGLCMLWLDGRLAMLGNDDPRRLAAELVDDYLRGLRSRRRA